MEAGPGSHPAADLVVLELVATYDAFREMGSGHEDAVVRLRQKKPSRWTEERHARALELLRRLGLATGEERARQ